MCLSDYAIGMMTGVAPKVVSVGIGAVAELVPPDPYRIALALGSAATAAGPVLGPRGPNVSAVSWGAPLASVSAQLNLNVRDHGALVNEAWVLHNPSAAVVICYVWETTILPQFRKRYDEALNKITHGGREEFLKAFNNGLIDGLPANVVRMNG